MNKILIAEDNDSNYILMTYILKGKYDFLRARNGREAVDLAMKERFDAILMDLKMPIMDGLEATRRIRELRPDVPIIALTANVFDTDRQSAFDAGCIDFLSKPINRDKCLEAIERVLNT